MRPMEFPVDMLYLLPLVCMVQFAECSFEIIVTDFHRYALLSQYYISITLPTFYQCLELCVAFKLCRSLVFDKFNGRCTLNSDDYDRQHVWVSGYNFPAISKTSIPQGIGGACRGHTCSIDEMCVQAGHTYLCLKHGCPTVRCPVLWGHDGDLCFTLTSDKKTWKEAKDYCTSTGAEPLTIDSEEKYASSITWIAFRTEQFTRGQNISGMFWTGLEYAPPMPSWIDFNPPETDVPNLCMGMLYNRTGGFSGILKVGAMEAVSCDERHGATCQHRNPDQWP